ncbi:methanogenic corrinoid protein MtbC1 [Streptohalobacillus salinus]|uniref:Methanogenic corrinoid protein MtbC1 n=2 Tax=Streptohalobacillus salinus TaxID=621096 RepID=A0A2V3WAS8_9BACI|nr:methanogenic corrinoid protein MtbC1 [Streptohalobacillus salinus]
MKMQSKETLKAAYQKALLSGQTKEAYAIIQGAFEEERSLIDVYTVIADAMYGIGDLWETNEISIAQEHAATAITQFVLTQISAQSMQHFNPSSKKAAVFSIESNTHYLGIQMIKNLFNVHNILTYDFGPNVPNKDIVEQISALDIDYVAYSVTMASHLEKAIDLSEQLEEIDVVDRPIIFVGGFVFRNNEQLLEDIYYDYYFESISQMSDWLNNDQTKSGIFN